MFRITTLSVAILALGSGPLTAQVPTPGPRGGDASQAYIGTWIGPYQTEAAPPGNLRLVIARADTGWSVTLEVIADQAMPAGDVREFRVDGNTLSWIQTVMELECRSVAKYEGGGLKGETECWQGGAVAVTATFLLIKQ